MDRLKPTVESRATETHLSPAVLGLLAFSLIALTSLDFALHPHQGVFDPALHRLYTHYLGDFADHLGNFGFAAAATIPLSAGKKSLERVNLRGEKSWVTPS